MYYILLFTNSCSRSFQNGPDYSRMFQIIQEISTSFQNVPYYSKMFHIILKCSTLFLNIPDFPRISQIILEYLRSLYFFIIIQKNSLNIKDDNIHSGRPPKKRVNLGTLTLKGGRGQKKIQSFPYQFIGKFCIFYQLLTTN